MKTAAEIDKALSEILPMFEEGVTEKEISTSLDETMVKNGADGTAFETIIAGSNSARPHASWQTEPSEGDLVVCDMGALYKGHN